MTIGRKTYGIKVNHLPPDITKEQVEKCFSPFGSIASVSVRDGTGECYAFVNFYSNSNAQEAASKMNGAEVYGKCINCRAQESGFVHERRSLSVGEYTVKVTCVSKKTNTETLSGLFSFGNGNAIQSVRINPCPDSPSNFAYVNYFSQGDAERAVNCLDKQQVDGSQIRVKLHQVNQTSPKQLSAPQLHGATGYAGSPSAMCNQTSPKQLNAPQMLRGAGYTRSHSAMCNQTSPKQPNAPQMLGVTGYTRSHSAVSQAAVPGHPAAVLRQCSHPLSKPVRMPHAGDVQSSTIKVSIFGSLSSEDLEEVFSRFGEIREKPIIRRGEPNFSHVNFSSPDAVSKACSLNNATVKGVRVMVKIHVSQKQGPNQESREVRCTSLVASILQARHKEELERLKSEHQVSLKPLSDHVKVWGEKEQVTAVELCLELLMKRLEDNISAKDCELPCHSVPLFEQDSAVEKLQNLQASHGVEFCVLRTHPESPPVELKSFCEEVKECFTPTTPSQSSSTDEIPTRSDLTSFLKEAPQKSPSSTPETTWLWQNDSGLGVACYTPEVISVLNEAFAASSSGSFTLRIGSYKYLIDFSTMTQTNVTSGRSRPIKQASSSAVSIQWFYRDDQQMYAPYTAEDSAKIEQMFQSNIPSALLINGNSYTFDFATMAQHNAVSRTSRKIERRVVIDEEEKPVRNVDHVITLRANGVPSSLDPAIKELEDTIAKATIEKECYLYEGSSDSFKARLIKNMNKYFVTADLVDECLKLKGMSRYVERVYLLAEKEKISDREQCLEGVGDMEFKLPPDWKPQTEDVCLTEVTPGSNEWNKEINSLRKTLGGVTVVKLERIQNKWLWERYSFAKKRMSKTNREHVNEMHLFHGTRDTPPEKVFRSEKGVDFRFSREGLWGTGSYFAVNASYSDAYAYVPPGGNNEKQMFICKVLTGESYKAEHSDSSLRQPPPKPFPTHGSFEEERYDSVKGYTRQSYVYVVYDHEKVYPAFLVTYRK